MDRHLFTKLFPAGVYPILDPAAAAKLNLPLQQVIAGFRRRKYGTIQIRIKTDGPEAYVEQLAALPKSTWQEFFWISNDHPLQTEQLAQLPQLAGQHYVGCHMGWEDLGSQNPLEVRQSLAPCKDALNHLNLSRPVLGLSTHTHEHVDRLIKNSDFRSALDYIGFGPFRATTTKANTWPVTGIDGARRALKHTLECMPVVIIGGLRPADTSELRNLALEVGRGPGDVIGAMISGLLSDIPGGSADN